MQLTGKFERVERDFKTNNLLITFSVSESISVMEWLNKVKDIAKLKINVAKFNHKRSLDSNAYFWVLVSKMADVLGITKTELYEQILRDYGKYDQLESGDHIEIALRKNVPVSLLGGHWEQIASNAEYNTYLKIKGTSDYNTAEMSRLIDKVVRDAMDIGVEVLTPKELEELEGYVK